MPTLSILIPGRRERWLSLTVADLLKNIRGDTEIIVVADEVWPDPPIEQDERVTIYFPNRVVGQRGGTNDAARLSSAKYVMKIDAHCAVDEGFDVKLIEPYENGTLANNVTTIPRMYNLHVFDWLCKQCGHKIYQGPKPDKCEKCDNTSNFEMVVVWRARTNRKTDFARFDRDLIFQYWGEYGKRPEAEGDIVDVMCSVGACWLMPREWYWEIGGMDEGHGSWGQMGVELACKNWLSGGRQVVNKTTWFSHLFRTRADFSFPYPMSGTAQQQARQYSRNLWSLADPNKLPLWPRAIKPLAWLIEKFAPVPGWEDVAYSPIQPTPEKEKTIVSPSYPDSNRAAIYYTDGRLNEQLAGVVRRQISRSLRGGEIVSVSLSPIDFGRNIVLPLNRGYLTMFKQILAGLEAAKSEIVFFTEHDVLYPPGYFDFVPPDPAKVYYNLNVWIVRSSDGHALYYTAKRVSQLCGYRETLIEHYRKRVEKVEKVGYSPKIGFEPGTHRRPERVDDLQSGDWNSPIPTIDIKHGHNLTPARWSVDEFRDKRSCQNWQEADGVPVWGRTKGRFGEFLREVDNGLIKLEAT